MIVALGGGRQHRRFFRLKHIRQYFISLKQSKGTQNFRPMMSQSSIPSKCRFGGRTRVQHIAFFRFRGNIWLGDTLLKRFPLIRTAEHTFCIQNFFSSHRQTALSFPAVFAVVDWVLQLTARLRLLGKGDKLQLRCRCSKDRRFQPKFKSSIVDLCIHFIDRVLISR